MLRSLVGSEMCIRDSADVVREIAAEHGYEGEFLDVEDTGEVLDTISQSAETDARFLRRLAAREEYEYFVDDTGFHWRSRDQAGAPTHVLPPSVAWHARLMVLAWGVLIPVGVLWARFWKVAPHQDWPRQLDHKAWWHAHRTLQIAGVLVGIGALVGALIGIYAMKTLPDQYPVALPIPQLLAMVAAVPVIAWLSATRQVPPN